MSEDRRANLLGAFALEVGERLRTAAAEVAGRSGEGAAALVSVAQQPAGTIEELRRTIGLSHPATVRIVDRLVEQGLVERRPGDRGPALALHVTAEGARRARAVLDARRAVLDDVLDGLPARDAAALERALEHALDRLADRPFPTTCRLCDMGRCRNGDCPVVDRQDRRGTPPPPFRPIDEDPDRI